MDLLKLFTVIDLAQANSKIEDVSISIAKSLTPTCVDVIEATGLNVGNLHITCNWAIEMWKQTSEAIDFSARAFVHPTSRHYKSLRKSLSVVIHTTTQAPANTLRFNDFIDEAYGDLFLDIRRAAKLNTALVPEADSLQLRMSRFYEDKRRLAYCDLSSIGIGNNGMTIHLVP